MAKSKKMRLHFRRGISRTNYLRAKRLGIQSDNLFIANNHDGELVLNALHKLQAQFAVIDSIQTIASADAQGVAGSVTQIRAMTQHLVRYAKSTGCTVMIVGHVTKDGQIAGPRMLEHMVDTVLYLEGDKIKHYRLLRTVKNRFGATDEVGVFDLDEGGMKRSAKPLLSFYLWRAQSQMHRLQARRFLPPLQARALCLLIFKLWWHHQFTRCRNVPLSDLTIQD